ncbi:MAG: type II toxin-antitoxin system RelE/ParE family toxin [bacterium]|nr:type II toxin-antitoxin system RelE/ParE family toxin [bacterium]
MNEAVPRSLEEYVTVEGRSPVSEWLNGLRDRKARARVRIRLDRVSLGNFGDCRSLGGALHELRIDYGPGYRVYFGEIGDRIVLLLTGGAKRTQLSDIDQARDYWADYRSRQP